MRILLLLLVAPAVLGFTWPIRTSITDKPSIEDIIGGHEPPSIPPPPAVDIFGLGAAGCGFPVFPPCPMIGCPEVPCPEGEICRFIDKELRCTGGNGCDKCLDFCLIIDTSGSIGIENFKLLIEFLKNLIGVIGAPPPHWGAVSFNEFSKLEWNLDPAGPADSVPELMMALMDLEEYYIDNFDEDALTALWRGMDECASSVFNNEHDRDDCPNIALLITDGKNNVLGNSVVEDSADDLKNGPSDATLISIGIGDDVDQSDLEQISDYFFFADNFPGLTALLMQLKETLCP